MFLRFFSCLSCPTQGSCLQNEEHLSLQINLSARGERPADLDKLKPYVIEHIVVLLMAPSAVGGCGLLMCLEADWLCDCDCNHQSYGFYDLSGRYKNT